MSQLKDINSKRTLQQVQNQDNEANDILFNSEKQRKKKTTSLQGRPAKASQELRKLEDDIKKVAWRIAELDECCYLIHGGAQANHNQQHQNQAKQYIQQQFKSKKADNEFQFMLDKWQNLKIELKDPLGEKFILLSDKYFINILINNQLNNEDNKLKKEEIKKEEQNIIDIQSFLIIYAFQLFLKTDLEGFNTILKMLYHVFQNCEGENNNITIEWSLSPDIIILKIQNLFEEKDRQKMIVLYKLLYVVMAESFNYFNSKNELIFRKYQQNS